MVGAPIQPDLVCDSLAALPAVIAARDADR